MSIRRLNPDGSLGPEVTWGDVAAVITEHVGEECHWCRREAPCECMANVKDGGPWAWGIVPGEFTWTGDGGWSCHPERCMCTCGQCQAS